MAVVSIPSRTCSISISITSASAVRTNSQALIERLVPSHHGGKGELIDHALARQGTVLVEHGGVSQNCAPAIRELLGIARRNQKASEFGTKHGRIAAHCGDDGTHAAAHGLE